MFFLREEKTFANTDGTYTVQTIYRTSPSHDGDTPSRPTSPTSSRGSPPTSHRWGAATSTCSTRSSSRMRRGGRKRRWRSCRPSRWRSGATTCAAPDAPLAHDPRGRSRIPTELDRALGYEANYAGTSFVAPPEQMLGKLKYGPEFMNIAGRPRCSPARSAPSAGTTRACSRTTFLIIKNGVFVDYQTTREQATLARLVVQAAAASRRARTAARTRSSWADVQFQRMPNVSLLPGEQDDTWEDLIAATDRGIAIVGDGSFSIDQQRYNAPVRRPAVLRDPRRQDRRHAQGRRLPDPHAGVLERAWT